MKKLTPILILSLLFILVGCSTDIESLQERNNLYYKVNSDKPFSGSILTKYESGQKKTKGYLKEGKWEGLYTEWYKNGQMRYEGTYKNGKEDGLCTGWYENGKKKSKGTFKDGDGLEIWWYENGQKQVEGTYKDGELKSGKYWNEDGSPIQ
jgi:antitoxin component YwqK of YwqJK toxin-antitoxin module